MLFVQSEATNTRRRFPIFLVSPTDGLTPVTTESGGQPQISKIGAAFANTSATLVAIGNGAYYVELTATELNTAGDVIVRYKSANCAEFNLHADVLAVNVHDTVRMGMTALPNAAAEAAGGLYTRGVGAGQINQNANGQVDTRTVTMATDVMTAAALAADFTVENNAPVLAVLGALANAASSGDPNTSNTIVQMLKQLINTIEGTAGITTWAAAAVPANGVSLAEAIRRIYLDAGSASTSGVNLEAAVGARGDTAAAGDPNSTNTSIQMLKQIINTLEGTAGIPTYPAANPPGNAVSLAEAIRQVYTLASATQTVVAGTATAAQATAIQADTDDIQARLPAALVSGRMDSSVGAMAANVMTAAAADPTLANEIADQVWDEVLSGHLTTGTTGAALNGAGAAGDPWTTPLPGAYGAGTAGNLLGNLDDQVAAVQADTDNIQTRLPAALVGGKMDSTVGGGTDPWLTPVPGAYAAGTAGNVLGSRLDATVSSRATPAQVNTEVVDALNVDTYAEPAQGAPAASASIAAKVNYLYKFLRNKITSSETGISVYNDAGTVVDHKAPHADAAGVYTRDEFVSGP